jgi:leader peptidase (prepilin peptidase)/N-methyltransferase
MNPHLIEIIVFLYGICIGSFLNVSIFRIPLGKSIISPGSSCMSCHNPVKFYDNIPILSYIILRGKCRQCQTPFSLRYPLTELITGVSALFVYYRFGLSLEALIYFTFISALIVITFIDIDHQIIPDVISLPGIPICVLLAVLRGDTTLWNSLIASMIGILAGGGSLYLVAFTYKMFTGKEGMGGGDIKLLAMIGALVGWKGVLFTIFAGSGIGTFLGIASMIYSKTMNMKLAIPFGPFLSLGAIIYIFFGSSIINWYFSKLI